MKFRKFGLLATAAAVSLGMVGAASALDVDNAAIGGTSVTASGVDDPYPLASELDFSGIASGAYTSEVIPTTGTFLAGNLFYDIVLTNGVFDGNLNGNTVFPANGPCAPVAVINSGGSDGDASVRFAISGLNNCTAADPILVEFDLLPSGAGDASVQHGVLLTDGNTYLDGGATSHVAIDITPAFDVATTASNLVADVSDGDGAYRGFTTGDSDDIGSVSITRIAGVNEDLAADLADDADITDTDLTLIGSFAGIDPVEFDGCPGGTDFTIATDATLDLAAGLNSGSICLTADNVDPIASSDYTLEVDLTLDSNYVNQSSSNALGSISRNGTFATLPWTASQTQAGGTGSTNFVRVSNPTGEDFGQITAEVLAASTAPTTVGNTAVLAADLGAGEEVVFTAQQLQQALGDFGRGDILVSVEGDGAIIARLVLRPDGAYELNNR